MVRSTRVGEGLTAPRGLAEELKVTLFAPAIPSPDGGGVRSHVDNRDRSHCLKLRHKLE
jgi:hypothetical protein